MDITGKLSEEELIEYISLRLRLEALNNVVNSIEYSDTEKIVFLKMYLKEVK